MSSDKSSSYNSAPIHNIQEVVIEENNSISLDLIAELLKSGKKVWAKNTFNSNSDEVVEIALNSTEDLGYIEIDKHSGAKHLKVIDYFDQVILTEDSLKELKSFVEDQKIEVQKHLSNIQDATRVGWQYWANQIPDLKEETEVIVLKNLRILLPEFRYDKEYPVEANAKSAAYRVMNALYCKKAAKALFNNPYQKVQVEMVVEFYGRNLLLIKKYLESNPNIEAKFLKLNDRYFKLTAIRDDLKTE